MMRAMETLRGLTPAISQVVVQAILAGVSIVIKLAMSNGMSLKVLIVYRYIFAVGVITPLALIVERKDKPKLTWLVLGQAFLCGLFGNSLFLILYGECLVLTSAVFYSAMTNIIPSITLVLGLLLGLEQLKLKTIAGKAKLIGMVTSIGGAMLLIFYKGAEINIWSTNICILGSKNKHIGTHHGSSDYLLGVVLAICACFSFAISLIIQAKMMKTYPRPYLATAMTLNMAGIQSFVFAVYGERDWNSWKLGWNTNLLAALYMGIIASALALTLMTWCIRAKGSLYVSVFSPLMLIIVAILASLLLNEKLHVGSLLGGGIIICGLYVCLWGMGKELKNSSANTTNDISDKNSIDDSNSKDSEETELSTEKVIKDSAEVKIGVN